MDQRYRTLAAGIIVAGLLSAAGAIVAGQGTSGAKPNDPPIAMGTTKGTKYTRLVIRNAIIISGRGTPYTNRAMPPEGPIDIVIENGIITNMVPHDPVNTGIAAGRPLPTGDRVIDATGLYVMPGLVEMHAHLPGKAERKLGPQAQEYAYRLYLGHGITTVRDAGTGAGLKLMVEQRKLSDANQIVAPRLVLCQRWPLPLGTWDQGNTPDKARAMVRQFKEAGADCVKVSKSPGHYPDVLAAIADEAKKLDMFVMVDLKVSETDAVVASTSGVKSIEHFYGIPDAALEESQHFPTDYNYWDELYRFRWAGHLWAEGDKHPEKILAALDTMIKNGTNWNPTMAAYEDNREFARYMTIPWRETFYTAGMLAVWGSDASTHGQFHREWKVSDEVAWREFYQIWMKYVKEFYHRGGLLTVGSDMGGEGGLGVIRELELMQEAGLQPLDIIRVATTNAGKVLGPDKFCGVRVGCVADLAIVNGNPIDNLKVLYGRGYGFFGTVPRAEQAKYGGVKWTIKDGAVFDAQALLREVETYAQLTKSGKATVTSDAQGADPDAEHDR